MMLQTFKFTHSGFQALNKVNILGFSAQAVALKNFQSFRKEYDSFVSGFQQRLQQTETDNATKMQKPTGTTYDHPFHSEHHRLTFSPVKTAEFFHDFVGPEQVSPHYENFLVARKYLMIFWVGFLTLNFGVASVDLNWMAKSSFIPWLFWFQIMYFYLEARKSLMKPLLVRFYRRAAANECYNFDVYYHENIEQKIRDLVTRAKGQMDYYEVHQSYNEIKAESVNNFLANEYINLQNHINNRAVHLLRTTHHLENDNKNRFVSKIMDEAIDELNNALTGANKEKIENQMFDVALDGLRKGQCDYQNDPLLPLILNRIKEKVTQVNALTEEEQTKIISLSQDQLSNLKDEDNRIKREFLHTPPKIEGGLATNDNVQRIFNNWGN